MKKVLSVLMSMFLLFTVCIPAFKNTAATDSKDAVMDFSFGDSASLDTALTDAPPTDEKIPSTAGKYIAVGAVATVVAAAAVAAGAVVKRKKQDA